MMLSRCSIKPVTIDDIIIYELMHKLNDTAEIMNTGSGRVETPNRYSSPCVMLDGNGFASEEKRRLTVAGRSQPARSSRTHGGQLVFLSSLVTLLYGAGALLLNCQSIPCVPDLIATDLMIESADLFVRLAFFLDDVSDR